MACISTKCILRTVQVLGVIGCIVLAISIYQLNQNDVSVNTNKSVKKKASEPLALAGAGLTDENKESDLTLKSVDEDDDAEGEGDDTEGEGDDGEDEEGDETGEGGDETGGEDEEEEEAGSDKKESGKAENEEEAEEDEEEDEVEDGKKESDKADEGDEGEEGETEDEGEEEDEETETDDQKEKAAVGDTAGDDDDAEKEEETGDNKKEAEKGEEDTEEDEESNDDEKEEQITKDDTEKEKKEAADDNEKEEKAEAGKTENDEEESDDEDEAKSTIRPSKFILGSNSGVSSPAPPSSSPTKITEKPKLGLAPGLANLNLLNSENGTVDLAAVAQQGAPDLVKTQALELDKQDPDAQFKLADAKVWSYEKPLKAQTVQPQTVTQNVQFVQVQIEKNEPEPLCPALRSPQEPNIVHPYHNLDSQYLYGTPYDPEHSGIFKFYLNRNPEQVPNLEDCDDPFIKESREYLELVYGNQSELDYSYFQDQISEKDAVIYYIGEIDCEDIQVARRFCELKMLKYFALINSGITLDPKTDLGGKHWFKLAIPPNILQRLVYTNRMQCLQKVLHKKLAPFFEDVEFKVKTDEQGVLNPKIAEFCKPEPKIEKCSNENDYSYGNKCFGEDGTVVEKGISSLDRIALTPYCPLEQDHPELPSPRDVSLFLGYISHIDPKTCNKAPLPPSSLFALFCLEFFTTDVFETRSEGLSYQAHEGIRSCMSSGGTLDPLLKDCNSAAIKVRKGDPYYSKHNVECLNYRKVQTVNLDCSISQANPANFQTPEADLSQLYNLPGIEQIGKDGKFLEAYGFPKINSPTAYRSAPTMAVTLLWTKIHNFISVVLKAAYPNKTDNELFNLAKKLTIIYHQHYTFRYVFPNLLSEKYSDFQHVSELKNCYRSDVEVTSLTELTCALRLVHKFLPNHLRLVTENNMEHYQSFNESYGGPETAQKYFEPMVDALMREPVSTCGVGSHLQNHLLQYDHPYGLDLIAYDVQGCRARCVRPYVYYIKLFFKIDVKTWKDLENFFDKDVLEELKKLYNHPNRIELYAGLVLEKKIKNSILGKLTTKLIVENLFRYKCADKHFYTNSCTEAQLQLIGQIDFRHLFAAVAGVKVTTDPLKPHSKPDNDYVKIEEKDIEQVVSMIKSIANSIESTPPSS